MKVYFDNASTTQIDSRVLEAMLPFLKENYGNASSIHSFGRKARVAIESSRELIADFIGAIPSEIYFTSGGTEAINFIINGIAKTNFLETGKNELITSPIEHKAVLDTHKNLELSGFKPKYVKINNDGHFNRDSLQNILSDKTSLVSLMHTNNEIGTVNDVTHISSNLGENQFLFCDCVQAFGKSIIDVNKLKVHALSASAHKIYGPKGIGFAFIKSGTPLSPLIFGGSQERSRRGGTENVASIVGFAEAVKIAIIEMEINYKRVFELNSNFQKGIKQVFGDKISINTAENSTPYILSITFKNEYFHNDIDTFLMALDINGVAASQGSACTSGTIKPSHVILGIGKSVEDANGTIRFSFNPKNKIEEVDYVLGVLEKLGKHNLK
ncbi:MAG: cysteine desulfurase [Bacteroidetes bacterium]|nr:cysteine desulfurase [Bacteroidota bacterium]MBU1113621.1 cysteine desulfurase [Bacteroidota bacterium]MBU1797759.1 cysteine desulfurase [Bacteroidota bacterium]